MITYSNPRTQFSTDDWPYGKYRTTATFLVQSTKHGERVARITTDPRRGTNNKPKTTTYAKKVLIVDGSDDKTYIIELTQSDHISVMQSNLQIQQESLFPGDDRYPEVLALFNHVED